MISVLAPNATAQRRELSISFRISVLVDAAPEKTSMPPRTETWPMIGPLSHLSSSLQFE